MFLVVAFNGRGVPFAGLLGHLCFVLLGDFMPAGGGGLNFGLMSSCFSKSGFLLFSRLLFVFSSFLF